MNKQKRVIIILVVFLVVNIGNLSRNSSSPSIRSVDFLTIWVIGAISGLLIYKVIELIKHGK